MFTLHWRLFASMLLLSGKCEVVYIVLKNLTVCEIKTEESLIKAFLYESKIINMKLLLKTELKPPYLQMP